MSNCKTLWYTGAATCASQFYTKFFPVFVGVNGGVVVKPINVAVKLRFTECTPRLPDEFGLGYVLLWSVRNFQALRS